MLQKVLKNVKRPTIDFKTLKKSRKPNTYLVAPTGFCSFSPKEESPAFKISVDRLAILFEEIVLSSPNTEKLSGMETEGDMQIEFVQYSKGLGFPDTITVRFMDAGEGQSTLAIYSRSHYGVRDFGVNKKRVKTWMRKLKDKVATL